MPPKVDCQENAGVRWRGGLIVAASAASVWASDAQAQAGANALAGAKDAFGFKTGDDSVGIYTEESVRGFNLEAAGNYRLEGTYFVKNSGVSAFFLQSTTVRIGYNTLGTTLPGPSGVVDYELRDPERNEPSTWTMGVDVHHQPFAELHFKHRTADNSASMSLGVGRVFNIRDFEGGSGGQSIILAGSARVTLGQLKIRGFAGEYHYERPALTRIAPAPDRLPRRIPRGRYLGQDWSMERGERRIGGIVLDNALAGAGGFGGTLVFSQEDPSRGYLQVLRVSPEDETARATMIAVRHQRSTAWSGELRAHIERRTGSVAHRFDLGLRGRKQHARFGGSQAFDLGETSLAGRPPEVDEPDFADASADMRGAVDQWSLGLTYRAVVGDRLRINAGVMRSHYRKEFAANAVENRTSARPLLYNIGGAWQHSESLELYASQSRGLEEAGVAPASATNRNELLNAILVSQREIGIRYQASNSWTAVLAGFNTSKPYAGIEPVTGKYAILGDVRHRGVEASLTARPASGLSLLLGGVFIDPRISGPAVDARILGSRPVGVPKIRAIANADYSKIGIEGLSIDAGVTLSSSRPARTLLAENRQLSLAKSVSLNLGARYRFRVAKRGIVARWQVQNVLNSYSWEVNSSETLTYSAARRFRLLLTGNF
jgi:iron complex outermembrane recepter protein